MQVHAFRGATIAMAESMRYETFVISQADRELSHKYTPQIVKLLSTATAGPGP